jgi:branched-chain amino acid transport system ATP-binding protein
MILEVSNINTFYGLSHILHDVSLYVGEGETVCLLGRNGAGKSTTFRSIMGLTPPKSGSIRFRGIEIAGNRPFQIARLSVGFVPEDRRIYSDLTVLENLKVAQRKPQSNREAWTLGKVFEVFPKLEQLQSRRGLHLSGGEQQMLTIARTLMGNPELILLDEPSEGLAPLIVKMLGELIQRIKQEGVTVLLAEQNSKFAIKLSDRGYVIDDGKIRYHGSIAELSENEEIKRRYLAV